MCFAMPDATSRWQAHRPKRYILRAHLSDTQTRTRPHTRARRYWRLAINRNSETPSFHVYFTFSTRKFSLRIPRGHRVPTHVCVNTCACEFVTASVIHSFHRCTEVATAACSAAKQWKFTNFPPLPPVKWPLLAARRRVSPERSMVALPSLYFEFDVTN